MNEADQTRGSERFKQATVDTLVKRAANTCSNPDCMALTSGPSNVDASAINLGEAAHIFGARPGSARYDAQMSDGERSDITNAIWLCRNCHKKVDSDPTQFPAALLFEWRRSHEREVIRRLGKPGALLRQQLLERQLEDFSECGYLARQIIIDKPQFWEHKLTAELLRHWLEPVKFRWEALEQGLYAPPTRVIAKDDFIQWQSAQIETLNGQVSAISNLFNIELPKAWGPPGETGSEKAIYRTSSLIVEACRRLLEWEESVRFIKAPDAFADVWKLLCGIGSRQMRHVLELPHWLADIFRTENPSGTHHFSIICDMPDGWEDEYMMALRRAAHSI
ncbi:HNH endonuclease [Burkholderia multivorans]|uniref:HNH endonuclease n=1 Tax=Burkholderia multivorans TaxID=87883 RepID=UPI001C262ED9|nr:HNH endonuclease [Burkholderia multivorans]MBU9548128.1 HNH endonuclease [Burkholderia multivorans]